MPRREPNGSAGAGEGPTAPAGATTYTWRMTRPQDISDLEDIYVVGRDEARRIDREATDRFGIPSILLMENAALHLAEVACDLLAERDGRSVLIVVGPGSNGGDGLALARHLHNDGLELVVLVCADPDSITGDARTHLAIAHAMGIDVRPLDPSDPAGSIDQAAGLLGGPDLVVDAIFGIGQDRALGAPILGTVKGINDLHGAGASVLAVDTPTGLDPETGCLLGDDAAPAVDADVTVTFCAVKRGFLSLEAQGFVGEIVVADIGAPAELIAECASRLDLAARPGDDPDQTEPGGGGASRHAGDD